MRSFGGHGYSHIIRNIPELFKRLGFHKYLNYIPFDPIEEDLGNLKARLQKQSQVNFSEIKGANHFFKEKEKDLRLEIEKYIKEKTALI